MKLYVDTNVLLHGLKMNAKEVEVVSQSFRIQQQGHLLVSSVLTAIEIDRVLKRNGLGQTSVTQELLQGFEVLTISPSVVELARHIPVSYLKTLDALHMATALVTTCDAVITLDKQFARACGDIGLPVL
ncbi:MAG: type II toxin-antitoxin system VapC family toxin [Candidatus Nanopelagicales bacterium]|nr:type II toxin-antitoxin system VapC family toxin [Candidatus Nanopelagicales bacterium]MCF8551685.1 type II toxin-antitoxin system VapC family toxin [Candidatus Nanopelagicales bacterium]